MSSKTLRQRLAQGINQSNDLRVLPEQLTHRCDPASLGFVTTDELPILRDVIGQPRAFRALELGSEVAGIGYNVFVLGIPDSGRTTLTRNFLLQKAAGGNVPDDWCYVNNFENPRQPRALRLPPGKALEFRNDMRSMIQECKTNIARAFTSDEYIREHERLVNSMKEKQLKEIKQFEDYANRFNFILIKTPYGFFLSAAVQGKPLSPEEFEKLTDEQKEKLHLLQVRLSEEMEKMVSRLRVIEQETAKDIEELDLRTSLFVIQPLIEDLKQKYAGIDSVLSYLNQVQTDLVRNSSRFRPSGESVKNLLEEKEWAVRYEINVLVSNIDLQTAPVVVENQPTYHNLLGAIDHDIIMGASYTDFSHIRAGALHRANGGYLILPARDVLINPYAWEGLKRVLRDGKVRILELGSQMGLISTTSLEPEPIPLNVKVILVGTPMLYYLLRAYDEDFAKLFKVRAEFATEMDRNPQSEREYALFVKSVAEENKTLPFDCTAVARIIDHGSRLVEHQGKLSTQFGIIADLICESAYWAKKNNQSYVNAGAVQKAIDEKVYRSNLVEERIQELIQQNLLQIDVAGKAVGQINALSVLSLGDYMFGKPTRVTASCSAGQGGVIDIERQAKLGGPIHTKGVLILNGFFNERFGKNRPINLIASLTFEQSYDEIEGDSASAAELIALLSAISGISIFQYRAITGSINQHGVIQAIGGVNAKIEGFFDTCHKRGLTGAQGVVIPDSNRCNLMLKDEVRAAIEQGKFHLWAVKTIDEAVFLLTGLPFGERHSDGNYPSGTLAQAVAAQLDQFRKAMDIKSRSRKSPATQDDLSSS